MEKIKILWLTENYPPRRGGMAQACDRIVSGLRSRNIEIDVAFFNGSAITFKSAQQQNGKLFVIPCGKLTKEIQPDGSYCDVVIPENPAHGINCLYNYLTDNTNRTSYSHIAAFGGSSPMIALPILKKWLNTKAVSLIRGNDFDIGIFQPAKRLILEEAFQASNATCVLYESLEQRIHALFDKIKIVHIPNGIDTENWSCDKLDFQAANKFREDNVPQGSLLIGLIGQLKEKKGINFFLENTIRAGLQNKVVFLTVGDVEDSVQEKINQLKDRIKIIQKPFMDRFQLLSVYPACDYIALPSFYDGMPNVLLEAGALGIPAIAARAGGITEILPPELLPLSFHPGNSDQCRQALTKAVTIPEEERRMCGLALAQKIRREFSSHMESDRYETLFRNI